MCSSDLYNLVVPTWFAMTALGAFSVTYNLVKGRQSPGRRSVGPILFGIVGALFVVVLGNLAEIHLILLKLGEGVLQTFQSTIPGLKAGFDFVSPGKVQAGRPCLPTGMGPAPLPIRPPPDRTRR